MPLLKSKMILLAYVSSSAVHLPFLRGTLPEPRFRLDCTRVGVPSPLTIAIGDTIDLLQARHGSRRAVKGRLFYLSPLGG